MSLSLRKTNQFEKDVKRMAKRGMPIQELNEKVKCGSWVREHSVKP